MSPVITPNWHIAVVHFPIALLAVGLFAEVVGALFGIKPENGLRLGGRWMLLFGAFAGLPVAGSGYYALWDVLARSTPTGVADGNRPWHDLAGMSSFGAEQWEALIWHARVQTLASVVALGVVSLYLASGDLARRYFYLLGLFLLSGAVLLTMTGAHLGGEAVYVHGTGVGVKPATLPTNTAERVATIAPPMELHPLLAGSAVSLGVLAIALAFRNTAPRAVPLAPIGMGPRRGTPAPAILPADSLLCLASVLALGAAATGTWYLARGSETWALRELWQTILPVPPRDLTRPENAEILRRPVHVVLGLTLAGVPLVLALWHRWRPEGRFVLMVLGLAYVVAATAQLPLGALMLLDGPTGPILQINIAPATLPAGPTPLSAGAAPSP